MTKRDTPKALVPVGRKRVIDEAVVRKLEDALSWDCTVEEACAHAGIGVRTYYDERDRNEEFAQRMERAQQFPFVLAKKVLVVAMKENDGNLAMKFLKNRQRDRYHEKVEQDVKQTTVEEKIDQVEKDTDYPEHFVADSPTAEIPA